MSNKWYSKILPSLKSSEVKALQDKLDLVVGELKDTSSYDVKFFEAEGSTGFSGGSFEMAGIDQTINATFLQKLYVTEPWVYIAVNAIAKDIAGLPLKGEKKTKVKQQVVNDYTLVPEVVDQDVWVDASGEKIFRVYGEPNKFTTKAEFYMLLVIDLLVCGQYFVCLDSDVDLTTVTDATAGDPNSPFARLRGLMASDTPIKGMYRIPPQIVRPVPSETGPGVEVYAMESEKGIFAFSPAEIIHVRLPNPMNPLEGLSPLIPALKSVLLDRYSTEHIIRFYKSGARLGGVIETGKALNKEQLARFQRSFENNYTGRANHHRTLILPPEMTYKPLEINPAETALLEFCKYNRDLILAIYNVPPIKVGIMDHANYANANVQLKLFYENTIKPLLVFLEDGFNAKPACFPDRHTFHIKFDLSQVESLKENFKDKADAGKSMIEAGLSPNEVRKRVWNVGPVKGGDKVKAVEDMGKPTPIFASAPEGEQKTKTEEQQGDMAAISSDITPTKLTFTERVNQLVGEFVAKGDPLRIAVPKAIAQAIQEGFTPEDPNDPKGSGGSAPNSDGGGTPDQSTPPADDAKMDSASNQALIHTDIAGQKPIKDPEDEEDEDEKAGAVSLDQFLRTRLAAMGDSPIDAAMMASLISEFDATGGSAPAPKMYANGMQKDHIVTHWKGFIDKTNPLILARTYEVQKFFKHVKSVIMNKLGANIKSFGLHKARDEDDVNEILNLENFEKELKEYIKNIDKALEDAFKYGYVDTLGTFEFSAPSEVAKKRLQEYAAARVKGILDTTRDQMRDVISEAFEEGVAMGEVSSRIQDKFKEIDEGRAVTIARTETLTAVSMGREEKRADWVKEFPDRKLMKMWVSAQDDKVRDSHQEYDGKSVEADEEFAPGLKFPRDPDCADPSEVINCRCTDITFDSEDKESVEQSLPQKEEEASDTE